MSPSVFLTIFGGGRIRGRGGGFRVLAVSRETASDVLGVDESWPALHHYPKMEVLVYLWRM
jgi:hypothetical protein